MKITLIRHGKTEGNYKKRYIGSTDEPLADTESISGEYPDCERVFSSPMKRCIQTAQFIYPEKQIEIIKDLRECDFGDFENKTYEELKDNPLYVEFLKNGDSMKFPNGEDAANFRKRCVDAFHNILCKNTECVSCVVHGGTIMAVMQDIFGGDFYDYQIKNGEYISIENTGGEWRYK